MPRWRGFEEDEFLQAARAYADRQYLAARAKEDSEKEAAVLRIRLQQLQRLQNPPEFPQSYTVYADDQPVRTFSAGGYIPSPPKWEQPPHPPVDTSWVTTENLSMGGIRLPFSGKKSSRYHWWTHVAIAFTGTFLLLTSVMAIFFIHNWGLALVFGCFSGLWIAWAQLELQHMRHVRVLEERNDLR